MRPLSVTGIGIVRGELFAPVVLDVIAYLLSENRIEIPMGSKLPVAVLDVEKGTKAHVITDDKWVGTSNFTHIRSHPRALTRSPLKARKAEGKKDEAETKIQTKNDGKMEELVDEVSSLFSCLEGLHILRVSAICSIWASSTLG